MITEPLPIKLNSTRFEKLNAKYDVHDGDYKVSNLKEGDYIRTDEGYRKVTQLLNNNLYTYYDLSIEQFREEKINEILK